MKRERERERCRKDQRRILRRRDLFKNFFYYYFFFLQNHRPASCIFFCKLWSFFFPSPLSSMWRISRTYTSLCLDPNLRLSLHTHPNLQPIQVREKAGQGELLKLSTQVVFVFFFSNCFFYLFRLALNSTPALSLKAIHSARDASGVRQ